MYFPEVFGVIGVLLSLLRYITYLRAIFRGSTKPHVFTWVNAVLMSGIAFAIQWIDGAGPGLWTTGVVVASCALISLLALKYGEKDITRDDWVTFIAGLVIIPVWLVTESPLTALILVLLIEVLGYYPTLRKSYHKPQEEDLFSWFLSALRWVAASLAVSNITVLSLLYPVFIAVFELGFVLYLMLRLRQIKTHAA